MRGDSLTRATTAVEPDAVRCERLFLPGLPPCRRRGADHPAERAIERRIRVISHASGDLGHAKRILAADAGPNASASPRDTGSAIADQFDKTFCKRRTRNSDFPCERFDGPRPIRLRMKQSKRRTYLGIVQARQPSAAMALRRKLQLPPQQFEEKRFGQSCQHGAIAGPGAAVSLIKYRTDACHHSFSCGCLIVCTRRPALSSVSSVKASSRDRTHSIAGSDFSNGSNR